jgi:death-on-curing protein
VTREPVFLTVGEVLEAHEVLIETFGGTHGLRDAGGLDSALAMPQQSFGGEFVHRDLYEMAAAYAFHVSQAQAFLDGNKRTAVTAALAFLEMNGIHVHDPQQQLLAAMLAVADHKLDKAGLAAVLKELAAK